MSADISGMNAKTTDAQAKQKGDAFAKQFAAAITEASCWKSSGATALPMAAP